MKKRGHRLTRPKNIPAEFEEKFFLLANLMFGTPNIGKKHEQIRQNFRTVAMYQVALKNVTGYLQRTNEGRRFYDLALEYGYRPGSVRNLYVRYVNWFFKQEAQDVLTAALRMAGKDVGDGSTGGGHG